MTAIVTLVLYLVVYISGAGIAWITRNAASGSARTFHAIPDPKIYTTKHMPGCGIPVSNHNGTPNENNHPSLPL